MIYIGIDPGKNGGIAVINDKFPKPVNITVYKYSDDDLIDVIDVCTKGSSIAVHRDEEIKCVLEKVNAMPGQGVVSMFNFGQNFGFIQGVLKAYEIPFELVPPQKWKKEFSVTSDKNTSIEVAKRLFPGVNLKATEKCKKDHDGMAEALLMAEYARRHL
jgi:crossover junction endodeoxyribonuclease RuvC